jgi:hypothetical protein
MATNFRKGLNPHPPITSHPPGYGPPQPLEPPAVDTRSNRSASPHAPAMGWGSPTHGNLPSPGPVEGYAYPGPTYGAGPRLYYPGSNIRRSTEPLTIHRSKILSTRSLKGDGLVREVQLGH